MENKVSVIIPMYNSEKYIKQCLDSVVNQTYKNLEIIVVDDGSTDLSFSIVQGIQEKDDRVKIIKLDKNKGVATARNKGVEIASGDYICFIDSDDIWVKDKVEKQFDFMNSHDYSFIYSNYAFFKDKDYDGTIINNYKITNVPESLTYKQAIKNTAIFVSTVMLNMNKLRKEDIYMPNLQIGQDTATWWKILKKDIMAFGMNEVLAFYRVNNASLSSNKIKAVIGAWKIYKMEEMNVFKRVYCFICYIKNAILRRLK